MQAVHRRGGCHPLRWHKLAVESPLCRRPMPLDSLLDFLALQDDVELCSDDEVADVLDSNTALKIVLSATAAVHKSGGAVVHHNATADGSGNSAPATAPPAPPTPPAPPAVPPAAEEPRAAAPPTPPAAQAAEPAASSAAPPLPPAGAGEALVVRYRLLGGGAGALRVNPQTCTLGQLAEKVSQVSAAAAGEAFPHLADPVELFMPQARAGARQ